MAHILQAWLSERIISFMTNYMVLFLSDGPSYAFLPIDALLERGQCVFRVQSPPIQKLPRWLQHIIIRNLLDIAVAAATLEVDCHDADVLVWNIR